jgi:hypothetical protein
VDWAKLDQKTARVIQGAFEALEQSPMK